MTNPKTESEVVRTFVAVPLPPPLRAAVASAQSGLQGPTGIKWVEPENFHFTLRFLGSMEARALPALESALRAALSGERAFELALAGVGAFPSIRRPQAIWVGVSEGGRELEALARRVEDVVVAQGFPPEKRPFRAHLTLGRVKAHGVPAELVRALEVEPADRTVGRMQVAEVVLMRSELRRSGPVYTPLAVFPLRPTREEGDQDTRLLEAAG